MPEPCIVEGEHAPQVLLRNDATETLLERTVRGSPLRSNLYGIST